MAYARYGRDSSVYVYKGNETHYCVHVDQAYRDLYPKDSYSLSSLSELQDFLKRCVGNGLMVPEHTFERIDRELKNYD